MSRILPRLFVPLCLIFGFCALALPHAIAMAGGPDAGAQLDAPAPSPSVTVTVAPTPPVADPLGTVGLVILGLGLATATVRRAAPAVHFFQTSWGMLALSVFSAVATGVTAALTTYGFSWRAIVAAGISAATSALCAWNPSSAKAAERAAEAASLVLFFLAMGLSACAATGTDRGRQALTAQLLVLEGIERGGAAYEKPHEVAIVDDARGHCQGEANFRMCVDLQSDPVLAAFRRQRAEAEAIAASVRTSVPVVRLVLDEVDAKKQGAAYDPAPLLLPILKLMSSLRDLASLMGLLPPGVASLVGGK